MIKNNFKILKKPHAYLQTILKAPVKFQKDRPKTVGGVKGTRYLLPIYFCSIRTQKMSKLKSTCKVSKDWLKTVVGVTGSRYLLPIRFCSIRTKKMSVKNAEKVVKNYFRILKKSTCISSGYPKSPCKVSKGSDKNCGRS